MTTQARELAGIISNAGDLSFIDDVTLKSDGSILNFGADSDVNLTHVADTGLLLNSTRRLQFGDSGTYIYQSADGVLDLVSDTEVEINATTIDINGNVDISGTLTVAGALDFGDLDISNVGSIALDTITNDGTDLTLDSSGDIIFDADGKDIILKDGGTEFGRLKTSSTPDHFYIKSAISNNDLIFQGNDGGSSITALTLDMSEAGAATFNSTVTASGFVGNVTGNASGTAATVTTAAQTNITSLGTLTALTVSGDVNVESGTFFVDVSNNNVGLGTTSPATGNAGNTAGLHIKNSAPYIRLQDDTGTASDWEIYAFDDKIHFYDNTNDAIEMTINGDGQLGLGTATPESYNSAGRNLVVVDSGNSGISLIGGTSSTSSVMFGDGTGGTAAYRGAIKYDHSTDDMIFWSAAAEKFRFTADGEIGIGGTNYGTDGQILTSAGAGAAAAWEDAAEGGISTGKAIAMAMVFG